MKRALIYTAGVALAGAAFAQSYYDDGAVAPSAQGGYPPCSATITDRCIQLYEPGVATEANLALNERLGDGSQMADAGVVADDYAYSSYDNSAVGGPYEPIEDYPAEATAYESGGGPYEEAWSQEYAMGNWPGQSTGHYPPCSVSPSDDRCIQLYESNLDSVYY